MGDRLHPCQMAKVVECRNRKKLGIRILEKLRTIHLLEAHYNTGTKLIFAQRTLQQALKYTKITIRQEV